MTSREAAEIKIPLRVHATAIEVVRRLDPVLQAWPCEASLNQLVAIVDSRGCHACRLASDAGLVGVRVQGDPETGLRLLLWSPTTKALRDYLAALGTNGCTGELRGRCVPAASAGSTPRQQAVLRTAIELGYFEQPKRITLARLAVGMGISESAVGRLLRRAIRNGLQLM